jgi:hypothetical protein
MPMPEIEMGALMRVPMFGSHPITADELTTVSHAICYGIRVEGSASWAMRLLHLDPHGTNLSREPLSLIEFFSAEAEHAVRLEDGDPSIPEEVCVLQAKLALVPDTAELSDEITFTWSRQLGRAN